MDDDFLLVREYPATSEDGRPVKVFVRRMPAQFWKLTSGDISMTTGSGDDMGRLMDAMARAIADGMLGFRLSGQRL